MSDANPTLHPSPDMLRAQFPGFRIWQEIIGDRVRYVARSLSLDSGPHTIVTDDLDELRAVLNEAPTQPQPPRIDALNTGAPNVARIYNRWLGGKDTFEADRQAADAVVAEFPEIALVARANRAFVVRAVAYVAAQGITQFIDVGAGLPSAPSFHETATRIDPAARVAYVDHDPVVLAHARALLATGPAVAVVAGDICQPDVILSSPDPRRIIDLGQPVCVILAAVHFLPPAQADAAVTAFRDAIAPGSYLIISSGTSTGINPALIARLQAAYQDTTIVTGRTVDEIAAYFTGLHLVSPGLTDVWVWRPRHPVVLAPTAKRPHPRRRRPQTSQPHYQQTGMTHVPWLARLIWRPGSRRSGRLAMMRP